MSDKKTPKSKKTGAGAAKDAPEKPPVRERDQVDLFIEEVTEELQRERAYALFRQYGPFVGAAVVLIVIAASVNEYMKGAAVGAAREAGGALIEAVDAPDRAARIKAFEDAAAAQEGGPALIAKLHGGALKAEAGQAKAAADAYNAASAAAAAEERPIYADLAALRAVMAEFDSMEASAAIAALEPLSADGRPFRALALEFLGLAQAKAGRLEDAKSSLESAELAWGAAEEPRRRVRELLEGLGAQAAGSAGDP